jgi:hypothetical protein
MHTQCSWVYDHDMSVLEATETYERDGGLHYEREKMDGLNGQLVFFKWSSILGSSDQFGCVLPQWQAS